MCKDDFNMSIYDRIHALPTLQETVRHHTITPQKKLGQNFLYDLNVTDKIVRIAGNVDNGTVIEIGPGPGGLTRAILLRGAKNVVAIDMDERAIQALSPLVQASDSRLAIHLGDARTFPIWEMGTSPRQIIANLPYNIGTHLLTTWLEHYTRFDKMTLMFQKEVAERITAPQGHKHYGRLSVLCNWACHTHLEMTLARTVFTPPPKVDSAVVTLVPRTKPVCDCDMQALAQVTKSAFGQRRKMIRSSLKMLGVDVSTLLEQASLDPTKRAEDISIEGFGRLAQIYKKMC